MLREIYKSVRPACVGIAVERGSKKICFGSGVCIDKSGWILTAKHVVEGYYKETGKKITEQPEFEILFTFKGKEVHEAISATPLELRMSPIYDIALIKIEEIDGGWPTIDIPEDDLYEAGMDVATIGYPLRDNVTSIALPDLYRGTISRVDEKFDSNIKDWKVDNLLTDMSIHPGNSGGALFDSNSGELLGLVVSQRIRPGEVQKIVDNKIETDGTVKIWTNMTNCVPYSLVREMKNKF